MPRATVASRELKNKETGLDLFVPVFKEIKGRISSTVYYQVVVVSNLSHFKTPSHKETDVVQCSFEKQWADFENLRLKLEEVFPGTVLPPLDKKAFIVNETVLKARRSSIEAFMKFLASTSKLAACPPLLQFLGVDTIRANKAKSEAQDGKKETEEDANAGTETVNVFGESNDPEDDNALFDEDENDDFLSEPSTIVDDDVDGAQRIQQRGSFSMFEAQDLKPETDEEDEKAFGFVQGAIITKKEKLQLFEDDEEDKEDLFKIEDDLDDLFLTDAAKKRTSSQPEKEEPSPVSPTKLVPAAKPKPSSKPSIPSKPGSASSKPSIPSKKPSPSAKTPSTENGSTSKTSSSTAADNLMQDDLMAYLQENMSSNTDDVDLFS